MTSHKNFCQRNAFLTLPMMALLTAAACQTQGNGTPGKNQLGSVDKIDQFVQEQLSEDGTSDFWVVMEQQADLSAAASITDWKARGEYVYDTLRATAFDSQAPIRTTLDQDGAAYHTYWIANVIYVKNGSEALAAQLASDVSVSRIEADAPLEILPPTNATEEARINAVEWNVAATGAPDVWSTFGTRGEGIVVANIDTGVEFDHPAVIAQYRGNNGGDFDHNYNWHDPSNVCAGDAPCDNNGHGTHTMGSMVGDDGGANQIGVAPGATWIAAKGCEFSSCSSAALLASGEWMLAPTDLNGQNPRPDLRPHVVNNSWGSGGGNTFYESIVEAWVAAGIFPAFSNGNSGPFCNTSGSPGDFPNSYSSGAFDIFGNIAGFSSRGPSAFGGITKPNIAAPGVAVRSSVPGGGYSAFSGTSMASPHTAAAVALVWSVAPSLIGDIDGTRALLDSTAVDTESLACGGTAENNNVFGQGTLDAFAAVDEAPRGPTGFLTGIVSSSADGSPVSGALIAVTGPSDRDTRTNASGAYTLRLPVGSYDLSATAFGFATATVSAIEITDGGTVDLPLSLVAAPSHAVSGVVRDEAGRAVAGAEVDFHGTPIPTATADAAGNYSFASVPEGTYQMVASASGRCFGTQVIDVVVDGAETVNFVIPRRVDDFGYSCATPEPDYIEASDPLALSGDDRSIQVTLPFAFPFYGLEYSSLRVCTNGYVSFTSTSCRFFNSSIPSADTLNAGIYPYWDDLFIDSSASMHTEVLGSAPDRQFVIEWRNARYFADSSRRVDVQIILSEGSGTILAQYRNISADNREQGGSATIGIENETGQIAFQYSFNEPVVESPEFALEFSIRPEIPETPEVTIDNHYEHDAELPEGVSFSGTWNKAGSATNHFGNEGLFAVSGGELDTYRFTPTFTEAANYRVQVWNNCFSPRSQAVPHIIVFDGGSETVLVDQDCATGSSGEWQDLGTYPFAAGNSGFVEVSDGDMPDGEFLGVDGMRFLREGALVVETGDSGTSSTGNWLEATGASEHHDNVSLYATGSDGAGDAYRFAPTLSAGEYLVLAWNSCFSPRDQAVPHTVAFAGDTVTVEVDQDCSTGTHGEWYPLGVFPFADGDGGYVEISNDGLESTSYIGADAVMFVPL